MWLFGAIWGPKNILLCLFFLVGNLFQTLRKACQTCHTVHLDKDIYIFFKLLSDKNTKSLLNFYSMIFESYHAYIHQNQHVTISYYFEQFILYNNDITTHPNNCSNTWLYAVCNESHSTSLHQDSLWIVQFRRKKAL